MRGRGNGVGSRKRQVGIRCGRGTEWCARTVRRQCAVPRLSFSWVFLGLQARISVAGPRTLTLRFSSRHLCAARSSRYCRTRRAWLVLLACVSSSRRWATCEPLTVRVQSSCAALTCSSAQGASCYSCTARGLAANSRVQQQTFLQACLGSVRQGFTKADASGELSPIVESPQSFISASLHRYRATTPSARGESLLTPPLRVPSRKLGVGSRSGGMWAQ